MNSKRKIVGCFIVALFKAAALFLIDEGKAAIFIYFALWTSAASSFNVCAEVI